MYAISNGCIHHLYAHVKEQRTEGSFQKLVEGMSIN